MPRLFNAENCPMTTFALTSMASNATQTQTFTGLTTADFVFVAYNDDAGDGVKVRISAADTVEFGPEGASGGGTSAAQTVCVVGIVSPTSGAKGGASW